MKVLQRSGGVAALYLALAYLTGILLFILVLDYPNISSPAQKVALLVDKQTLIYATNLLLYVLLGPFLIVLALALYERLHSAAPALSRLATVLAIIWAGMLIASGMVANAGIAPVVALYEKDPVQAALTWQTIETVANGLSFANREILGGMVVLLFSWAALQAQEFPRGLSYYGVLVGALGIVSIVPVLGDLGPAFGIAQIVWFIWLAIALLSRATALEPASALVR